jgi:hypothetical protein
MISFRLTAEEYDRFRDLCSTCGARSVSELARMAINSLLHQPASIPQDTFEYRVAELEGRVNMLRLEFTKLHPGAGSLPMDESAANSLEQ